MEVQGTINANGQSVQIDCSGLSTVAVQLVGSPGEAVFQGTVDGTNWHEVRGVTTAAPNGAQAPFPITKSTFAGIFRFNVAGLKLFRVLGTNWMFGGPVTVTIRADIGSVAMEGTSVIVSGDIQEGAGGGSLNKPVFVGGLAVNYGFSPNPTPSSTVRWPILLSRSGQVFTVGGHPNSKSREYVATTGHTDLKVVTVDQWNRVLVTGVELKVSDNCTVPVNLRLGFGQSVLPVEPADGGLQDGMVLSLPGLLAGNHVSKGSGSGLMAIGGAGEDLIVTHSEPTNGKLTLIVHYFTFAA